MELKNINRQALLCATVSTIIMGAAPVSAAVLEEIVITAQKREQNLQSVGISVTAMSGTQMSALGLDNTMEISQQVPGLQVLTFSPAFTILNLRGVSQNNFQDNLEAPVAAYFDDVYIGSMNAIGGQMFDMKRMEVLRGPQGTLFGRNATGGLVHFITNKADDAEFNGYAKAEISEFNSYSFEAAAGGSLSEKARIRVAGRWEKSDGYVEPGTIVEFGEPFFGGNGKNSNGADGFALRTNLQMDVGDETTFDLTIAHSEDNDAPIGQWIVFLTDVDANGLGLEVGAPITGDVHKHGGSEVSAGGLDTGLDREVTSITGRLTTQLTDNIELVSVTNWMDMDKSHREDGGGGLIEFGFMTIADYKQWSQEIRLSGDGEGVRWQVGGYYLDMTNDTLAVVSGPIVTGFAQGIIDGFAKVESTNWSLFGQIEYDFSDTLTVIGGFRWSEDDKNIDFFNVARSGMGDIPDGTVLFDLDALAVGEFADVPNINYGDYATRLQLNWQANEDTLVFASYNRGIKGGNWSPNAFVDIAEFKHKEETLHAYELGIKTSFAEGKARLNATAFYYDYKDYQAFSLTNLTPQVTNSDATNKGGEIELFLLPTDNWDIILGGSFIDSKIDQAPGAAPGSFILDAELPSAPGYSFNYLVRYNMDMLEGNVALQVDGVFNDQQFLESHNGGSSIQNSYGMANASISYTSGDSAWDISVWVKNLTDEEVAIYSLDIGGFIIRQYNPPRQFGLTATYNW